MKSILWFLAVYFCTIIPASIARDDPSNYSQSYAIMLKGVLAGSETVTEKSEGGNVTASSEHEMMVTDGVETKRMKFSTRMVFSKSTGTPVSYSYWYTSGNTGDSYNVTIKNSQITRVLSRGGRTSEVTVPLEPDMVFVDFNVYHQYDYLVRRYDTKKGGRQTFADFIPVIGSDIPLALTYIGEDKLEFKTGSIPVRNFRVEFVGIWGGMVSVDKANRLVRLVIPSEEIEVIRRDLLPDSN
jgi:hypothetical protein